MDHFQTILTRVRMLLSSHRPSQVQALLDNLLAEELLSREYHYALLHESDDEALARKISLTLLEKGDPDLALLGWIWSGLQAPTAERDLSYKDPGGSGQCPTMELGPLEGSYLELLNSSADPLQLYHLYDRMDLTAEEEIDLCSEPDTDTINCEQFSRLLCDMEGDEETREAYANIAELDQYVFQDTQLEGLSKDIFIEHIGLEEMTSESVEVLEEAGQKTQKRPFPEELPVDLKHRKLAPPSSSLLSCLSLPAGPIQIIPTLSTLPQGLWPISGTGTGVSSILIYQSEMPPARQTPPSSGPAVQSLPKSPDRPGSTSPFAPSAADLPSMPEPALTSRANLTEDEMSPTKCPAAGGASSKLPKWPESVEQFYQSLRDKYLAQPTGPEGTVVEMDLVRVRLEKSSGKSQERELATLDWAERQPARGGLAEVLLAASDRQQPRETRVIAVLGKAGHGKSHWARAVSQAWAHGQLPQYDFVFWVPCHRLDRLGTSYRLQDLLSSLGPQPLPVNDEVLSYIARKPNRILLVLDGFEELEAHDGSLHSTGGPGSAEPRSLRGLLAGLLQRKLLRGCTLLLTAWPRGRLAQSLSKADALFEVAGFSAQQAETYVKHYFESEGTAEHQERALALLRAQPFLLSHSHSPTVCQAVCQLTEALLQRGDEAQLPSTLTGLYVGLLGPAARDGPPGALAGLARLAWELGRAHQRGLKAGCFPSAEARAWAVAQGWLRPTPGAPETELAFSSFLLQCFLGAVWLALSGEIKDKELPQYLALTPRKKRPYDNWLEGVPRFLVGLVFQPRASCLGALAGPAASTSVDRKQKVLTRYLKRLQPGTLRAGRLLELLHCAHEALDPGVWQHVLQGLPARLSFLGTRLTPPDTHVLGSALEAAGQDFSLDLRSTGIDPSGLGSLVGLSCVTRFRAALSDTVELWESLQQCGEAKLLRAVEEKFTIEPFKAKSMKDVEDLGNLVQIQRTRSSSEAAAGELPAIRDLKKLEFALGPVLGPQVFPKLVKILEAFTSLQHLDLDSLSENKIGDEGVAQLSATFPQLKALETLNLSQNNITDVGACKLAEALPALAASLLRLSLYNNCICDAGAESLAHVLPDMVSLRVLDVQYNKFTAAGAQQLAAGLRKCPQVKTLAMWTPTIPFGVQEHLQQLDPRIILR
ncbi:PREDICTED: MHC class II transactivator isoform X2 [Capra hircus]|uniref:MHC class II transactivator isoform X2 n=1 Tax=Capra hircus TaxID=9925 RepID=UPI0008470A13|nr:PREDICTED: MHC class II transactivator isoform X2 [Capra hircus]